ncbi:MAG: hypothetical protein Kow0026_08370 [Oricola sp.]
MHGQHGQPDLFCQRGIENNRARIGGRLDLLGDPDIKPEKPYTIIGFPGGDVEIARTTDNRYWVHVAVREGGEVIDARIDLSAGYADEANAVLRQQIETGGSRAHRVPRPARFHP